MAKYIEIGERLRKLRAHRSQKEFAKKLNLHVHTYINYESGIRIPKGDVLYRIAALTGTPVDWILGGEAKKEQTDDEIKDEIRNSFWINKIEYTEEDIERSLKERREREKKEALTVSEEPAIYNNVSGDTELSEIVHLLKEHPQDKKLVLKLLKGKKDIKEALEGFEVKNLLKKEG